MDARPVVPGTSPSSTRPVAAETLRSIGQLAAGIAHEINTPVQYIGDNIRFLRSVCKEIRAILASTDSAQLDARLGELLAEVPDVLEQSLLGIERVSAIVRSVRELAPPDDRRWEPVDLNRAVEATLLLTADKWKHTAAVVTDLDPTLPRVPCLADEIKQVLLDLVVNAAQAIRQALGDRPAAKGEIHISTARIGRWVEIQVADTGCGIPEAARTRVFDPFFTTKETGEAIGQGLAISHNVVVARHGGEIFFVTEEGKGTTFTLRLPVELT